MGLIDTHCHLDMLGDIDEVLGRATAAGVDTIVTIGESLATSEAAIEIAGAHANVYASVGLHPHHAKDRTDALMTRLRELAALPKVVAIGEAGLDYHYDNSPRPDQRAAFAEQVRLAHETSLALVIHTRDAWDDTFAILRDEGVPERTVFHCFSGGASEAERSLEIGAYLSFSGIVTFPKGGDLREAAAVAPLEKIVVETDAPFLAPVPHRGRPNEPAYVIHTAAQIAEVHGVTADAVATATSVNARRLFALPEVGAPGR